MKKSILFILLVILFTNCKNESESQQEIDTGSYIFEVKNDSDYNGKFLEDLKKQKLAQVILDGNSLTIDGELMTFPEYPKEGKSTTFTGKKDGLTINLTINRKNQTTINYAITMMETGKGLTKFKGEATIASTFYLGLESDESSISKLMYPVDEYLASDDEDCYIAIRLGKEEEELGNQLLGKLIKNCNGDVRDIDLDDFPTLMEQ